MQRTLVCLRRKRALDFASFYIREKRKRQGKTASLFHQQGTAKQNAVVDYLKERNIINKNGTPPNAVLKKHIEKLDKKHANVRFLEKGQSTLLGLQGLTDHMPLSYNSEHQLTPQEQLLHQDEYEHGMSAPPAQSYSGQLSRKIMAGNGWPSVPQSFELRSVTLEALEHESNMSPSARAFSEKALYHIMRNIKACPIAVREGLRFEELILSRVVASRRSSRIYIVWSTITPGARLQMEPLLERLNFWICSVLKANIKTMPNIPAIMWVYDHGNLQQKLPKDLKRELKNVYSEISTTTKDRVKYLKQMDTLSHRLKDVPWFMPYLWGKEKKMTSRRAMGADLAEVERRKSASPSSKPNFVS